MDRKNYVSGLMFGGSAFVIWGLLPIYWKMIGSIDPYQIFAHRVVWSFVFVMAVLAVTGKYKSLVVILKDLGNWRRIMGPAFVISVNWLLFIYAVNNGYVIEASLGYFINPLVLTTFGAIFYKERLTRLQVIGLSFAFTGVLIKSFFYGSVPIVGLSMAVSFGTYGLLKKKSRLTSLEGLAFETLVISVPSFAYILFVESKGIGLIGNVSFPFMILVSLTGVATAVPLLFYAEGAKRLPLSVLGFLQYIGPSIMLVIGVYLFGEVFDQSSVVSFGAIWTGLAIFSYSQVRLLRS